MRNLGKKVRKKRNFIISARDGVKPVIKRENSAKSGNVGISGIRLVIISAVKLGYNGSNFAVEMGR